MYFTAMQNSTLLIFSVLKTAFQFSETYLALNMLALRASSRPVIVQIIVT